MLVNGQCNLEIVETAFGGSMTAGGPMVQGFRL